MNLLLLVLLALPARAQDTTTTRTGLVKPAISSTGWGPKLNTNFDWVDQYSCFLTTPNVFLAGSSTTVNGGASWTVLDPSSYTFKGPGAYILSGTSVTASGFFGDGGGLTNVAGAAIQAGSIDSTKLAKNSVDSEKLSAASVERSRIQALAVDSTKLANGAADSEKLAKNSVNAEKVQALTLDSTKIGALAIDSEKLAALAVDSEKIRLGAVQKGQIGVGAVETDRLASGAVNTNKILVGAVQTQQINMDAVDTKKLLYTAHRVQSLAVGRPASSIGSDLLDVNGGANVVGQLTVASTTTLLGNLGGSASGGGLGINTALTVVGSSLTLTSGGMALLKGSINGGALPNAEGSFEESATIMSNTSGNGLMLGGSSTGGNGVIMPSGTDKDLIFGAFNAGAWKEYVRMKGATGNVGIGTTSPGAKLQVGNNSTGSGLILDYQSDQNFLQFCTNSSCKWLAYLSGNDLRFGDLTDRITFKSGGNVGIGTTAPGSRLDVAAGGNGSTFRDQVTVKASSTSIYFDGGLLALHRNTTGTGNYYIDFRTFDNATEEAYLGFGGANTTLSVANQVGPVSFVVSGSEVMKLSAGRVGIGTTNPGTTLHMSSGTLTVDGTGGGIRISSGNTTGQLVSGWLSGTGTFNPGTIPANSCVDSAAITIAGAAAGNECYVGEGTNAAVTGVIQTCYVSASDAIKVRACCSAGAGTCVTTSQTYRVTTFLH